LRTLLAARLFANRRTLKTILTLLHSPVESFPAGALSGSAFLITQHQGGKMSFSKTLLNTLIAGAFAVSMAGITGNAHAADDGADKEKCYGIAKAGQNDCAAADKSHSCAAHAMSSGAPGDFVILPKGVCAKINGGSMMMEGAMKPPGDNAGK
jgi:uncharacterized membrane protein